jgi:hypothetical protein
MRESAAFSLTFHPAAAYDERKEPPRNSDKEEFHMKHPLKKLLSLLMALAMLASLTAALTVGTSAEEPPYQVGGTPISTDASTPGDGWVWEHTTRTLTLNNAAISAPSEYLSAIMLPDGATVVANGSNTVSCAEEEVASGICCRGNLTFAGTGTLTATGGDVIPAIIAIGTMDLGCLSILSPTGAHVKYYPHDSFSEIVQADDRTACSTVTLGSAATAAPSDSDPAYQVTVNLVGSGKLDVFSSGSSSDGGHTFLTKDGESVTISVTTKQVTLSATPTYSGTVIIGSNGKNEFGIVTPEKPTLEKNVDISKNTTVTVTLPGILALPTNPNLTTMGLGQMLYGAAGLMLTPDMVMERAKSLGIATAADGTPDRDYGMITAADALTLASAFSVNEKMGAMTINTPTRLVLFDAEAKNLHLEGTTATVDQASVDALAAQGITGSGTVTTQKYTSNNSEEFYIVESSTAEDSGERNATGNTDNAGTPLADLQNLSFISLSGNGDNSDQISGLQFNIDISDIQQTPGASGAKWDTSNSITVLTMMASSSASVQTYSLAGAMEDGTQLLVGGDGTAFVAGPSATDVAQKVGGTVLAAATDETVDTSVLARFKDADTVPAAQKAPIAALVKTGIINGTLDGKLNLAGDLSTSDSTFLYTRASEWQSKYMNKAALLAPPSATA